MSKLQDIIFNAVPKIQAIEQLNLELYECSDDRNSYHNVYRTQSTTTRVGTLVLHVSIFRDGTFSSELFSSYQRSEKALLLGPIEMVIQGVSTRKISQITATLCGTSFS